MDTIEPSILKTIKKMLSIDSEDNSFDVDVITAINSTFTILEQLGIGPDDGFQIQDDSDNWTDYSPAGVKTINLVKTYIYLKCRLVFDPPTNSFLKEALENQIQEYEWRLNAQVERTK